MIDPNTMSSTQQEPEQKIYIYHTGIAEDILGPGKRLVVWTSGCPFNCKGCIEPGLHDLHAGEAWIPDQYHAQIRDALLCLAKITFSGGEPLFQAKPLLRLIQSFDPKPELMLYTGYEKDEAHTLFPEVLAYVDILVAGPYLAGKAGSYLWRGSKNQTISSPSGVYSNKELEPWLQAPSAGMEIHVRDAQLFIYGVPPQDALQRVYSKLHSKGIEIS